MVFTRVIGISILCLVSSEEFVMINNKTLLQDHVGQTFTTSSRCEYNQISIVPVPCILFLQYTILLADYSKHSSTCE